MRSLSKSPYDWISPLNKQSGMTIYFNTAVYGEKWVWYFWSLAYFHFFAALNGAFEVQFFQDAFDFYYLIKDTDSM